MLMHSIVKRVLLDNTGGDVILGLILLFRKLDPNTQGDKRSFLKSY